MKLEMATLKKTRRFNAAAVRIATILAPVLAADGFAAAPTATTLMPTNVTTSAATLRGSVNPGDLSTSWYFQYGLTTNYGSGTVTNSLAATNVGVAVTQAIGGLILDTTYQCRLVASNGSGLVYGTNVSFTTTTFPAGGVTNVHASAGIFTNVAPGGANFLLAKVWGAGGSYGGGGGGAFSSVTLPVRGGQTFVSVTGQRGVHGATNLGGVNNGVTSGGAPGYLGNFNNRGQGGQASSLFAFSNGLFFTKAVAGAGGGTGLNAHGGAGGAEGASYYEATGGQPGSNGLGGAGGGSSGANYSTNALTVGIASLNLAGGNGGNGLTWSGGGGGGYGGGGGGGGGTNGAGAGGGGGGSFGTIRINGNGAFAANTSDPHYAGTAGNADNDGRIVLLYYAGLPPVASTLPASNVTPSSGSLNGFAAAGGRVTRYYFDYGATTNYGQATATNSVPPSAGALRFNGTNQFVQTSNTLNLAGKSFSVSAWARRASSNRYDLIFQQGANGANNTALHFGFRPNNTFTFAFWGNDLNTANAYTDTDWHHWEGTFDAGTGARTLYRDGVVVASDVAMATYQGNATFTLGRSIGTGSYFAGEIDEVRIWTSVRSPSQVTNDANDNVSSSEPSLLAQWRFEEGSGATTADATTNANTGGLVGSPAWIAPGNVTTALTSLQFNTTYNYRLVAWSDLGASAGTNVAFTTLIGVPTATTLAASSLTTAGATLNATMSPNGGAGIWYFQHGLTTNYGGVTATGAFPATNGTLSFNSTLTGLNPGTLYNFRVVASNNAGLAFGSNVTFATVAVAPSVTTLAVSSVTPTGATFNASVNPNGAAGNAYFQLGLTTNYGSSTALIPFGATNVALSLSTSSGLSPGSLYHFRAVASNSFGVTFGGDATLTTPATLPNATTLAASSISIVGATLNATVNPGGSAGIWFFQHGLTTNYGSATSPSSFPGTNGALSFNSTVTGLGPGTLYNFRIVASNSVGFGFGSNVTFITSATAPGVTTLAASSISTTGATLNASVSPNGSAGHAYFQLGLTDDYYSTTALIPFGATNTTLSLSADQAGLVPGTVYHFRAVASNSLGVTFGADETLTTPASVPIVTTLGANPEDATSAGISALVSPGGAAGHYYFQFGPTTNYGFRTPSRPFVIVSDTMQVGEGLSGLNPGTVYHFRAVATNSFGTSFGNDAYFLQPHLPPEATTLAATNVAANSATLRGSVNPNGLPTRAYFEYGTTTNFGFATPADILPPSGAGLRFNGTNQGVAISNPVNLANQSFTVEAWARRGTTNRWDILLHQGNSGPNTYALHFGFRPNNKFTFAFWGNDLDTTNFYTDSDWHHWAGTFDAVTRARTLYCDGMVVASDVAPTTYQGTNLLWLARSPGLGSWFGGDLDEVRLWLGSRSAADILQDMNGGVTGTEPGLLAAWRLNEGSGATAFDASANANSGTLLNSPQWLTAASLAHAITNLQLLTTYYCRVVAESDSGTTYGNDVSFFTPAPAPTVTTLPATSITLSSAQLNGTATPNNWPQSAFFEYGASTAYGARTALGQLPATNITFPLNALLTNLLPGTFYHFRAAATNSTSGAAGADATFTTLVGTPTGATLTATGIAARSAVLNANVVANGLLTRYYFNYGLTTNYGQTSATNFVPPSASALRFDGFSHSVTTSKSLNLSNVSFTVESWARRAAPGVNSRLVQQGANGVVNNTLHLGFRANNVFTFGFWGNDLDTTNTYTDSNWHHWAATFDATTLARRIYRDGQLVASDTAARTYQGTNAFRLGGSPMTGTMHYGDLDEVRIWSGVRSQANIASGMATNATGLEPGLLACWRFDEGSGDFFSADSTPNGNHATLVNFPFWINPLQQANPVAGLQPAGLHHFRVVALNSLGASVGADLNFTTGPDASVATTLPASSVGTTNATLNALVELAGAATTVYFEYGPVSSGFVASTPSTVLSATNDTVPLSVPVTGLAPATFYQVRAVASNSVGVSYGSNRWFTTMLSPPLASTLPADGVTTNAAMLHGAIEHQGSITRHYFEYGADTNYGQFTATNVMRPIGAALRFNGTNQSVTISNPVPLIGRSFTIEAWVRRAAANRNDFFLQHNSSALANGALHLGFRANNRFTFAFWGNDLNTTNTYTDTDWHHWAATFDSTSRVRTIYRDGIPVASDISPSSYQANMSMFLGYSPPNNSWFGGDLDEVRIWDGVRTAAQIVGGMTTNALGSETNLLACWRLDEASGNFTGDTTLHGLHGSLINSPTWLTPAAPAELLAGLQPGTVYHYRLVAFNGAGISYGSDMIFTTSYAFVPAPQLNPPVKLADGSVRLSFTSIPGAPFSVLATTNIALPVAQWEFLGPVSETPGGSGQFQFTDPQATNFTQRFYLLRVP